MDNTGQNSVSQEISHQDENHNNDALLRQQSGSNLSSHDEKAPNAAAHSNESATATRLEETNALKGTSSLTIQPNRISQQNNLDSDVEPASPASVTLDRILDRDPLSVQRHHSYSTQQNDISAAPANSSKFLISLKILLYSLHNFSLTLTLYYVLYLQLPTHILTFFSGDSQQVDTTAPTTIWDKNLVLGIVTALSSLCNAAGGILFGFFSDLSGFRAVYIFLACILWNFSLFARVWLLNSAGGVVLYTIMLCFGMFIYAAQLAPYNALLPLLFPQSQYGSVSGMIGLMSLFGTLVGVGVFGLIYDAVNEMWIILTISVMGLVTSLFLCVLGEGTTGRCCARKHSSVRTSRRRRKSPSLASLPELELEDNPIANVSSSRGVLSSEQLQNDIEEDGSTLTNTLIDDVSDEDSMAEIFQIDDEVLANIRSRPSTLFSAISATLFRCLVHVPYEFLKPFRSRNFTLICFVRFAMYVSLSISQTYSLYFLTDMVDSYDILGIELIETPKQALSIFMFVIIFLSLFASVISGFLSDRFGQRKWYVFVSAILCAIAQLVIVIFRNFSVMLLAAFLSGIALGTFVSTDLALANDVLPSKEEAGKDLSIYASFFTLPQLVVPPLAGVLLSWTNRWGDLLGYSGLGYVVIFSISSVFAIICAILVVLMNNRRVGKDARGGATNGGTTSYSSTGHKRLVNDIPAQVAEDEHQLDVAALENRNTNLHLAASGEEMGEVPLVSSPAAEVLADSEDDNSTTEERMENVA